MKKIVFVFVLLCSVSVYVSSEEKKSDKTSKYSAPYMLGVALTRNITEYQFTKDEISQIIKGFNDGINKRVNYKEVINYEELNGFINDKKNIIIQKHKKEGESYLLNMAKEPNAQKFESGLVLIKTVEGNGDTPVSTDIVKVHYNGYFINGVSFDSSYKRGEPVKFALNQVIPCWTEALTKIKVGGKAKIGCPSQIAYGDKGMEPVIPPGSTLIFDVELLDIVRQQNVTKEDKKE
ncbi:MAG: FKBP-type peptidyl-prolyl cis-trans isomerase [Elusimicrobiota bacterium]